MNKPKTIGRNNRGLTLLEIMVSIIILMIIASIGIPKYNDFVERSYSANAKKYMLDIYSAQLRYALYHNDAFANDHQLLDAQIPVPEGYIEPVNGASAGQYHYQLASAVQKNQAVPVTRLRRLRPSPNNYILTLIADGTITCTNGGLGSTLCKKMGY